MILTFNKLLSLLTTSDKDVIEELFREAYQIKLKTVGDKVYLRGLIELSNICKKDCYYCGIRKSNTHVNRYDLNDNQVIEAALFAYRARYGSIVIQGGERSGVEFTHRVSRLIRKIKELSDKKLGITLSLGEQTLETYKEWIEAGAHRYLLRIETSNPELYKKIHPQSALHLYESRIQALKDLRTAGFQVGTGVMIGLPFQTAEDLVRDLLFIKDMDIDMVGMGPYLEHSETPLYEYRDLLFTKDERFLLSLKMVALLRLLMPDINIAATTALQVLKEDGREQAIVAGANVIMPNMTLTEVRSNYQIYENKPGINDDADITKSKLVENLTKAKIPIGWNEWGDSKHFLSIVR